MCIREHKEFDSTINPDYSIQKNGKKYFTEKIINDFAIVALKDSKVVGYLIGEITKAENYRTINKVAEVNDTVVREGHRGEGIGKIMFDDFIKWAKSKKVDLIRVAATAQNEGAIRFYKREGFEEKSVTLEKKA
jgi:GNAT superfamily N-acetyltransferase